MPELPEVETTLRGLEPHLPGRTISQVIIRNPALRWPIPQDLPALLQGKTILTLQRRAKYLLVSFEHGTLLLHLGMSGNLRILPATTPAIKHDHFDLALNNDTVLRLHDPRRFGAVLWHPVDSSPHPLLAALGPEPLGDEFTAAYVYEATRHRRTSIKQLIMDNHHVVGVGNIYANESLFRSGIRPQLAAGRLSLVRCERLVAEIRATLSEAISLGGSTLRDFVGASGQPGYFQQTYWVYGRNGQPCRRCSHPIRLIKQGQRSSFYCANCQR